MTTKRSHDERCNPGDGVCRCRALPGVGHVEVWRGHALDLIESVEAIDLLCTDPPYAMGGEGAEHAVSATVACVLREAGKKVTKGGWAVVYSASSWRSQAYMVEAMRGIMEPVRSLTWVKPKSRTKARTPGHAWASVNVQVFRRPGAPGRGTPSEVLDWIVEPPVVVGRRAQLPPSVAVWSVAPFAIPGGLALDPFSGSGALPRAAAAAGMAALGFEVEASGSSWLDLCEDEEVTPVVG